MFQPCIDVLFVIWYFLSGHPIELHGSSETFFAVTKLFQSKDVTLCRLVYLAIKEMSQIADDVIIVTSSLTKDMTGKEDQYRCHQAILYHDRCMCRLGCTVPSGHSIP